MTHRNDPCPCGSGKKYKKCCGAPGATSRPKTPPTGPSPDALMPVAWGHHKAGRYESAAGVYRQILDRDPNHGGALFGMAQSRAALGDVGEAVDLLRRSIAAGGMLPQKHRTLAALLHRLQDHDGCLAATDAALALEPGHPDALSLRATSLERLGREDEAVNLLEALLATHPDHAEATATLARLLRRRGRGAEAIPRLTALVERPNLSPHRRGVALNELGHTLEAEGAYAAAFDAFARSGQAQAETDAARRIDHEELPRRIDRYRRLTADLLGRWRDETFDDRPAPVFLVGFPRSGTTMMEQVLGSHPQVVATGEEPMIQGVLERLAETSFGTDDETVLLERLRRDQVRELRDHYWRLAEHFAGVDLAGKRLVDKQPMNIMELGLINVIFPDARVLVALRDPRDVCMSCFKQWFLMNVATVHFLTLEGTVDFYVRTMGLWHSHLRSMLTVPGIVLRYEDTVADLEGEARRVLAGLDLPWDPAVLDFHERARSRSVTTPSYAAVREPVHRRAVGRWTRYEAELAPYRARLAEFVDAFGYGPGDPAEPAETP